MPRRISDALDVDHDRLRQEGVFDGFLNIDSRFYVDPQLVRIANARALSNSYRRLEDYFDNILTVLAHSDEQGDPFWKEAHRRLQFPEPEHIALGYGVDSPAGSGIGKGLARQLTDTALQIVDAGIDDPAIFELVGLFEPQFGADRISDMVIQIIRDDLLRYTTDVSDDLELETVIIPEFDQENPLPVDPDSEQPIVLLPAEILTPLPVADDWSDVDVVAEHNAELRSRVNELVGDSWRDASEKLTKKDLRATLLRYPDLLRDLIRQYREKDPQRYDFEADPKGELIWYEAALNWTSDHPLSLSGYRPVTGDSLLEVVRIICNKFGTLIENNGLYRLLYESNGDKKHERAAQLLFYGVADAYCEANNLDLSREPNAGRGPVDFKVSRGYAAKVNVEVKLTSNTHLRHGYEKQLPAYNAAEDTEHSIYLVIVNTESDDAIEDLREIRRSALQQGRRAPEIVNVDARPKPSASNI